MPGQSSYFLKSLLNCSCVACLTSCDSVVCVHTLCEWENLAVLVCQCCVKRFPSYVCVPIPPCTSRLSIVCSKNMAAHSILIYIFVYTIYSHMYIEIPYIMFIIYRYTMIWPKNEVSDSPYTPRIHLEFYRNYTKTSVKIVVYLPRVSHVKS